MTMTRADNILKALEAGKPEIEFQGKDLALLQYSAKAHCACF